MRAVARALPSALAGLTTGFGMGPGGAPPLRPPGGASCCSLLAARCSLLAARCLLLAACCSLLAARCSVRAVAFAFAFAGALRTEWDGGRHRVPETRDKLRATGGSGNMGTSTSPSQVRSPTAISTRGLRASPRLHPAPMRQWSSGGLRGDLVSGRVSHLDAFSGSPCRTWPPGSAVGTTTGTPAVRPSRSSRTRDGSPQIPCAHTG